MLTVLRTSRFCSTPASSPCFVSYLLVEKSQTTLLVWRVSNPQRVSFIEVYIDTVRIPALQKFDLHY